MTDTKIKKYNDIKAQHNVGEIIRSLMAEHKIDDMSLAKATGIASSSLSRIKNDPKTNPTLASLQPIARYFGVTVSQLIGETALNKAYVAEPIKHKTLMVKQVPILAWDQISEFTGNQEIEFSQWIPSNRHLGEQAFALVVENSTWGEIFVQGAYLIADPDESINDGDYALVCSQQENKYFVKKVIKEGTDIFLQSLNPALQLTEKLKETEKLFAAIIEVRVNLKK